MVKVLFCPHSVPVGRLVLPELSAAFTSSMPICLAASAVGSTWTRTAYFCEPNTDTCATPGTMETRCAMVVSSTWESFSVGELSARYRMGWSAGFTLRNDGGVGMLGGRFPPAWVIADCT